MHTFANFLAWYNKLDVEPMLQAIQRQSVVYEDKGIDMLKDGMTLPGLAVLWLFGEFTLSGVRRGKAPEHLPITEIFTRLRVLIFLVVIAMFPINTTRQA